MKKTAYGVDALSYLKEYNEIAARNKHEKKFSSSDEFLSGLKKTDRLHPVISLCVYYGEDEWDGPLSLTDMLCIPEHLTPLVSDYKMNLIQIRNSDSLIFHNSEVHTLFDLSRLIYNKEFDKIQSTYMNQKFDTELSLVIGTITNTKSFINHALQSDSEGGSINMCRAFEEVREETKHEQSIEIAKSLLEVGKMTYEEIARSVQLPVEEVKALDTKKPA